MKNLNLINRISTANGKANTPPAYSHVLFSIFMLFAMLLPTEVWGEAYTGDLRVIGENTTVGWSNGSALQMTNYRNGTYSWTGYLSAKDNDGIKFLCGTNWNPAYTATEAKVEITDGGTYDIRWKENDSDPDNKFMLKSNAGYYRFVIELPNASNKTKSGTLKVTKVNISNYCSEQCYLTGDFLGDSNWGNTVNNTPIMENGDGYVYYRLPDLCTSGNSTRFKIMKGSRGWGEQRHWEHWSNSKCVTNGGVTFDSDGDNRIRANFTKDGYLTMCWDGTNTFAIYELKAVTYYIKHDGWGTNGSGWDWKELTDNGDGTYSCEGVYSANGCNWNTEKSGTNQRWIEDTNSNCIKVGSPQKGDNCTFTLNPTAGTITITKKIVTPVASTTIYVLSKYGHGNSGDCYVNIHTFEPQDNFTVQNATTFGNVDGNPNYHMEKLGGIYIGGNQYYLYKTEFTGKAKFRVYARSSSNGTYESSKKILGKLFNDSRSSYTTTSYYFDEGKDNSAMSIDAAANIKESPYVALAASATNTTYTAGTLDLTSIITTTGTLKNSGAVLEYYVDGNLVSNPAQWNATAGNHQVTVDYKGSVDETTVAITLTINAAVPNYYVMGGGDNTSFPNWSKDKKFKMTYNSTTGEYTYLFESLKGEIEFKVYDESSNEYKANLITPFTTEKKNEVLRKFENRDNANNNIRFGVEALANVTIHYKPTNPSNNQIWVTAVKADIPLAGEQWYIMGSGGPHSLDWNKGNMKKMDGDPHHMTVVDGVAQITYANCQQTSFLMKVFRGSDEMEIGCQYLDASKCEGLVMSHDNGVGDDNINVKSITQGYDVTFYFDGTSIWGKAAPHVENKTVNFVTFCAQSVADQSVAVGSKASNPGNLNNIQTQTGNHGVATFSGWYKDEACTQAYDFNTTITDDITLYAKWEMRSETFNIVGDLWMADNGSDWRNGRNPSFTRSNDKRSISVTYIAPKGLNRFEVIRGNDWGYKVPMDIDAASPVAINVADGHMNFTLTKHQKVTITYNGKFSVTAEDYTLAFVDGMYLITGDNWAQIEKEDGTWVDMSSGWHGGKGNNKLRQEGNKGILILRDAQYGEHTFKLSGGTDDDKAIAGVNLFNGVYVDTEHTSACMEWKLYTDGKSPWGTGIYYPSDDNHWRNIKFGLNNSYDLKLTFDGGMIQVTELPKHTITYKSEGNVYTTQSVYEGRALVAPTAPVKDDFSFLGWSETEGGDVITITAQKATEPKTYYAKFGQLAVETATLNKSALTLYVGGDAETLVGGATPAGVSVTGQWSVSPTGIVTVDNGVVTPVSAGKATVTYTVTDKFGNTQSATCAVSVQACQMTTGTRQWEQYNTAGMFNNAMVKLKFQDNYYLHVVDGTPKMLLSEDATAEWREIPTGETFSPAWSSETYPLFYLKHVETGKYLCRGNGQYGANGDWFYYVTTVVNEPTGDECLWFYDKTLGLHLVCREGVGDELKKSFMISICNINGADDTFNEHGAKPQVVCHYAPDPANNAYTKLATVAWTRSTNPEDAGMTFASDTKRFISEGNFTVAATSASGAEVFYLSSDPTVATVNRTTGEVTPIKMGKTTIKATLAADGCYNGDSKSYDLILSDGYYVAGTMNGGTWDPAQFKMGETENGYARTFTGLTANTEYQFKVSTGRWDGVVYTYDNFEDSRKGTAFYTKADGNIFFRLAVDGDITIRYNEGVVTAEATVPMLDGYCRVYGGQGDGWNDYRMTVAADGKTCSYTMYMGDGEQFNFKIRDERISSNDGYFGSYTETGMIRENHTGWDFRTEDNSKCYLKTNNAGDYTFIYDYDSHKVSIIFPNIYVDFDVNGGSTVERQSIPEGTVATKPADPAKDNLSFKHWLLGEEVFDFDTKFGVNTTLKAVYEATVTFMNGDATYATVTCEENGTVTFPTDPTRTGCTFNRWVDAEGNTVTADMAIATNRTYYAVHQAKITFDANGGSAVEAITVDADTKATEPTAPTNDNGASFYEWRLNGVTFDWSTPITENITLVAFWDVLQDRADDAVANGNTLTLEHDYDGGNLVVNSDLTIVGNDHTIGNLTITETGNLTISGGLAVQDFVIESSQTAHKSGQIKGAGTMEVQGNAYFDLTIAPENGVSAGWYAFTVPFEVSSTQGVYNAHTSAPFVNERDHFIMEYQGDVRAQGKYGWIKTHKTDATLHPGKLYLIAMGDTEFNKIRFQKKAGADLIASANVALQTYPVSGEGEEGKDNGWNAVGNPNLYYAATAYTGVEHVAFLDHENNAFVLNDAESLSDEAFVVGSAFVMQVPNAATMTMVANTGNTAYHAPARQAAAHEYMVELSRGEQLQDRVFLSASEQATTNYETGRELVKFTSMGTASVAQMSIQGYGLELCDADFVLQNQTATFPLTISVPKAGSYTLSAPRQMEESQLYVMYEGVPVWDLSMSDYEFSLTAGTTNDYSLLFIRRAPGTATEMEEISETEIQVEKILMGGHVFILREGNLYDVTGKIVR